MSTGRGLHHTYEEYLRVEELSELRHEYLDGEIYAMAGGTPEHAALAARTLLELATKLPACTPMTSDLRVRIEATGLTTYPGVSLVCGPLERSSLDKTAVTNPTLIVEVTSPSTEDYDRGDKLSHYKQLPSVRAVIIVSHASPRLTVIERDGEGWRTTDYRAGERATWREPQVELAVDAIYAALQTL